VERRHDAAHDAERDDEQEGEQRELGRVAEGGADDVRDRPALGVRLAEIALDEARDPVAVADEDVAVGPELLVQRRDGGRIGERAEDAAGDVAGQDLGAEEDDDAQQPERDDR
jgi:hypothetical protein